MLTLGQNNLYDFRVHTLADVERVLGQIISVKEKMLALNVPVIQKMYTSLELIQNTLAQEVSNKQMLAFNQAVVSFLDKDLFEIFLNDPLDEEMRYNMSMQLMFVSVATGNVSSIKPYTEGEMEEILRGKGDAYYDELIFLATLRNFFSANISGNIFSLLTKTLPSVIKDPDNVKLYYWNDAFFLSVMLHSIWRHFFLLSSVDQQFILQNYLYQSIVLGVPVRFALQEALVRSSVANGKDQMIRFLREHIGLGKEIVPSNILTAQGKTVGELTKEFLNKASTEQINTLIQEKFITDIYRGQEDGDFFSAWLRELLTLVWQLKSGNIVS